jgi:hypothetical protein
LSQDPDKMLCLFICDHANIGFFVERGESIAKEDNYSPER